MEKQILPLLALEKWARWFTQILGLSVVFLKTYQGQSQWQL